MDGQQTLALCVHFMLLFFYREHVSIAFLSRGFPKKKIMTNCSITRFKELMLNIFLQRVIIQHHERILGACNQFIQFCFLIYMLMNTFFDT